jgi:hypothetical protein
MQERGPLETELDERRLHPRQHARYLSFIDVADQPAAARAFDQDLLQHAAFDERRANLARRRVDQNLLALHRAPDAACDGVRPPDRVPHRTTPQRASKAAVSNRGRPTTPE